jgi:hypothetical protein
MIDYNDFPPVKYFTRVLKTCPKSALLYVQLWKNKSRNMNLAAAKKSVRKDYLISPTMFRNLLAPLMFLNLIHFIESDEKFQIDVLGSQIDE